MFFVYYIITKICTFAGPGGVMSLMAEIACIIFVIVSAIIEIRQMVKLGRKYFSEVSFALHVDCILISNST